MMKLMNQNMLQFCLPDAAPREFCFREGGGDPLTSLCARNLCWAIHIDDTFLAKCFKTAAQSCIHPYFYFQNKF
jgi:hypothetical protein